VGGACVGIIFQCDTYGSSGKAAACLGGLSWDTTWHDAERPHGTMHFREKWARGENWLAERNGLGPVKRNVVEGMDLWKECHMM